MGSEWREILLEDLADEVTVGFVGSMTAEYVEDGIPFFRSKNIAPYRILWDDMKYISRQFHQKIKKSSLRPGDVVIVRTGKPGTASIIPDMIEEANCSDLVIVRPGPNLDKRFLVYYLNSAAEHHINAHLVGAVQQHFNVGAAKKMSIPLPLLTEQQAIAHILGSLDNKIELNRRMNATLEAMAQALFKSWFVDFDPVIDNALAAGNPIPDALAKRTEARRQALADGTANREAAELFPAEFEFSEELGWIPADWEILAFESVFELPLRNGLNRPKRVRGEGTLMVNMGELFSNRRIGLIPMERVPMSDKDNANSLLHTGDLLFARQSLTLAGAGQVSWVIESDEPRTFEGHLIRCRIDPAIAEPVFFFYLFLSPLGNELIGNIVNQVAAAGIRGSDLAKLQMVIPPKSIQRIFATSVGGMESRIAFNLRESRTLTKLRDTLLPKLISGELRIPEAEKLVKKAME